MDRRNWQCKTFWVQQCLHVTWWWWRARLPKGCTRIHQRAFLLVVKFMENVNSSSHSDVTALEQAMVISYFFVSKSLLEQMKPATTSQHPVMWPFPLVSSRFHDINVLRTEHVNWTPNTAGRVRSKVWRLQCVWKFQPQDQYPEL